MKRILAQVRKELRQILRDRLALVLALALPVGIVALLGTTISLTVSDIPIVIQDLDQTPLSRQYADAFRSSITFRVISWPIDASPERALTLLKAEMEHWRVALFGDRLHVIVDGDPEKETRLISARRALSGCWSSPGSRARARSSRAACQAAGSSAWRSAPRSCTSRACCSWTSPRRGWIRSRVGRSGR